jgi:hypothetical protein
LDIIYRFSSLLCEYYKISKKEFIDFHRNWAKKMMMDDIIYDLKRGKDMFKRNYIEKVTGSLINIEHEKIFPRLS